MKTEFSLAQLADPDIAEADKILRACVHCGFCTATCPTYVLLGDELDSPRGRIYLIKEMLEKDKPPTQEVVKHIDRCLSCLACMTTCPSGVNYMHLVDQARVRIEKDYTRPLTERALRAVLAWVLPRPGLFRASMILARLGRPLAALAAGSQSGLGHRRLCCGESRRCWRWRRAACRRRGGRRKRFSGTGDKTGTGRLAARLCPTGSGAAHQSGRHQSADASRHRGGAGQGRAMLRCADPSSRPRCRRAGAGARQHHASGLAEADRDGLDAILMTTSGCGTVIKDYGFMLREDRDFAAAAAKVSALAKDITEYLGGIDLQPTPATQRHCRRLSLGLFAAARTENHASPERIAFQEWIRGERCAREPFVLRFGGDVQHSPA